MNRSLRFAIAGVVVAILITTSMDAAGVSAASALPLLPLTLVLWRLQRFSRRDMGVRWGRPAGYAFALLHPVVVIGAMTAIVMAQGLGYAPAEWNSVLMKIGLNSLIGTLAVMLTEEGFFRGWLWASLERASLTPMRVLVWSSVAFAAWHISAVVLKTGFNPPPRQVPVFLLNAAVMGFIWGRLRWFSGSILVSSFCHSVWNAVAYRLYGFGEKVGALGISDTTIYGPEVGILGLGLNVGFAIALFAMTRTRLAAGPFSAPLRVMVEAPREDWQEERGGRIDPLKSPEGPLDADDRVDESIAESFPASDPPSFNGGVDDKDR